MQIQSTTQKQFAILLEENRSLVYNIINDNVYNYQQHDDVFQEIALNAWASYGRFRGESGFSRWIGQIAKYTVVDTLRKIRAKAVMVSKYNMFYQITSSDISEEYKEPIAPVIDSLSDTEKRTVQMRIDGLTFREISEKTGEPMSRLIVRMHRIKDRLKKSALLAEE